MKLLIKVLVIAVKLGTFSLGFNIRNISQSMAFSREQDGSEFGYSVALHKNDGGGWLLVGAPKDSVHGDVYGSRGPRDGAVFKCSLGAVKQSHHNYKGGNMKCSRMQMNAVLKRGTSSELLSNNFERTNFTELTEEDDFDWEPHVGPTDSDQTGPSYDHTTQDAGKGTYMLLECSHPRIVGETAMIATPPLPRTSAACVRFWYHMRGLNMGSLNVYIRVNLTGSRMIWSKDGDQGDRWRQGWVSVIPTERYQIIFEGVVGQDYNSDIGLDDVTILDGACAEDIKPGNGSFGMTIAPDIKTGEVLACAPTWTYSCKEQYHITGLCYHFNKDLSETNAKIMSPCRSPNCNDGKMDLVFLIDGSDSVNVLDFGKMTRWMINVVSSLSIGMDLTRVGIAQYSSTARTEFHLNQYYDVESLRKAIKKIKYMRGKTATGKAIDFINKQMFTAERGVRLDAKPVVVVVTDGKSQDDVVPPSQRAKARGITLFAIGVGVAVEGELRNISSDPDDQFVYSVNSYKALDGIRGQLKKKLYTLESQGSTFTTEQCQSGTSAGFAAGQPVIGLPGLEDWSGGLAFYPNTNSVAAKVALGDFLQMREEAPSDRVSADAYKTALEEKNLTTGEKNAGIPSNATNSESDEDLKKMIAHSYFGYSMSSGFFSDSSAVDVAVGAPRHKNKGAVFVISVNDTAEGDLRLIKEYFGGQIGSYFGHSVCMADMNKDGIDELIVGAPLYMEKFENMGRVAIYISSAEDDPKKTPTTKIFLYGSLERNARFGFSIASAGDLNGDGFGDVVIGAPSNAAGDGAVYVYNGKRELNTLRNPSQILRSSTMIRKLVYFGFSLHAGIDVDGNGYPDIACGSPGSDEALVMLSKPVIHVRAFLVSFPAVVNISAPSCHVTGSESFAVVPTPCSSVEICFDVTGTNVPPIVLLEYLLKADVGNRGRPGKRGRFLKQKDEIAALAEGITCANSTLIFPEPIYDFVSEVVLSLEYGLSNRAEHVDDSAILNAFDKNPQFSKVKLARDCENKNCQSDLKIGCSVPEVKLHEGKRSLTLDRDGIVSLELKLENVADDAYDVKLLVSYRDGLYLSHIVQTDNCIKIEEDDVSLNRNVTEISGCDNGIDTDVGKFKVATLKYITPVLKKKVCEFRLQFVIANQSAFYSNRLTMRAEASSFNPDLDPSDNFCNVTFPVYFIGRTLLSGTSVPSEVSFPSANANEIPMSLQNVGPNATHTYSIANVGYFDIPFSVAQITWPRRTASENDYLYLVGIGCTPSTKCSCKDVDSIANPQRFNESHQLETSSSYDTPGELNADDAVKIEYRNELWINCNNNSEVNCTTINCAIGVLKPSEIVRITLDFRIWERTLTKMKAWRAHISSTATYTTEESSPFVMTSPKMQKHEVTVEAYNLLGNPNPGLADADNVRLWIIVAAVVAGILLLLLVAFVLHKLKFFESKYKQKKDDTLEWRDYQQHTSAHEGRVQQNSGTEEDSSCHQMSTFRRN